MNFNKFFINGGLVIFNFQKVSFAFAGSEDKGVEPKSDLLGSDRGSPEYGHARGDELDVLDGLAGGHELFEIG